MWSISIPYLVSVRHSHQNNFLDFRFICLKFLQERVCTAQDIDLPFTTHIKFTAVNDIIAVTAKYTVKKNIFISIHFF